MVSLKLLKRRAKALGVDVETIEDLDDAGDKADIMVHSPRDTRRWPASCRSGMQILRGLRRVLRRLRSSLSSRPPVVPNRNPIQVRVGRRARDKSGYRRWRSPMNS